MGQDTKDRITNPTGSKLGGNPFAGDDTNNGNPTGSKLGGVPEEVLSQQSTQTIVQQPKVEQQKQTHENGGTKPKANNGEPPVNDGSAKVAPAQGTTQNQVGATSPESVQSEAGVKPYGFVDKFIKKYGEYKEPTPEELEKERKKKKREAIFAAIGDGVSALANLYFTSQGAFNSYDPKNSMSAKWKARWDKVQKDRDDARDKYFGNYLKAAQLDYMSLKDQANLNENARQANMANDTKITIASNSNQTQKDIAAANRKAESDNLDKRLKSNEKIAAGNNATSKSIATTNAKARAQAANAAAVRGVRGKQLGFADGNGNQVSIYENVWKGSMQNVYDAIIADGVAAPTRLQEVEGMTPAQKEDFVKANWTKSPRAQAIMMALSKIDPATMTNEVQSGEDYSQYQQQDDDYSQYEVK